MAELRKQKERDDEENGFLKMQANVAYSNGMKDNLNMQLNFPILEEVYHIIFNVYMIFKFNFLVSETAIHNLEYICMIFKIHFVFQKLQSTQCLLEKKVSCLKQAKLKLSQQVKTIAETETRCQVAYQQGQMTAINYANENERLQQVCVFVTVSLFK